MLVMNDKGMEHLLSSKFKLGAEGSAAAGPVGRQAEANTDWKMRSEVLSYSRARGVFAGLELNGAVIKQDDDDTRILYGKEVPFKEILEGHVAPRLIAGLLATVRKYAAEAKQERGAVEPTTARLPIQPPSSFKTLAFGFLRPVGDFLMSRPPFLHFVKECVNNCNT